MTSIQSFSQSSTSELRRGLYRAGMWICGTIALLSVMAAGGTADAPPASSDFVRIVGAGASTVIFAGLAYFFHRKSE